MPSFNLRVLSALRGESNSALKNTRPFPFRIAPKLQQIRTNHNPQISPALALRIVLRIQLQCMLRNELHRFETQFAPISAVTRISKSLTRHPQLKLKLTLRT